MKKLLIMILALTMALAFASCGNDGSKEEPKDSEEKQVEETSEEPSQPDENGVYQGFYKVELPEGYVWDDINEVFEDESGDLQIRVTRFDMTLQDVVDVNLNSETTDYTDEGEATYGDFTWRALGYTWIGSPSTKFITESSTRGIIVVDAQGVASSDPLIQEFVTNMKDAPPEEDE